MPLYEYRCSKCDKTFEVIRKFSDSPLTEHENCGGPVERLLSAPTFQLKGTGWYVTDYAKSGSKSPDSQSSESSGESKPAASDSKAQDSKSSDAKSTESKSETKASETKKSENKAPAAKSSD
ncbi:MAG: zinc ribbon domain-containing protein [Bryobacterales bacterium]|nr:zinc ribbon domain-containing protein [Bryobacterales bacterium]